MQLTPEDLYRQFGSLIESMPMIPMTGPLDAHIQRWIGRVDALVQAAGDMADQVDWRVAVGELQRQRVLGIQQMETVLYRSLARAELEAPPSVRGAFIPVGNQFDAYSAIARVVGPAKADVLIADPYLDGTALIEFGGTVPEGVMLRLLADKTKHNESLITAAGKWIQQYGASRPLSVRLAAGKLHDRVIIVDGKSAWSLSQSLKDFAKKTPGEIIDAASVAELKIPAYADIWDSAKVVV